MYERTSGDLVVNVLDAYEPLVKSIGNNEFTVNVWTNYGNKRYTHSLSIQPLFVKNYQYLLLEVFTNSKKELYPLSINYYGLTKKRKYHCVDEREYLELVERLLDSSMTTSILKSIRAAYANYLTNYNNFIAENQ